MDCDSYEAFVCFSISDISKKEEKLKEYQMYKDFLFKLSPPDWREAQQAKTQQAKDLHAKAHEAKGLLGKAGLATAQPAKARSGKAKPAKAQPHRAKATQVDRDTAADQDQGKDPESKGGGTKHEGEQDVLY